MNEEIFPLARVSFIIFNYEKKGLLVRTQKGGGVHKPKQLIYIFLLCH